MSVYGIRRIFVKYYKIFSYMSIHVDKTKQL